MATPITLTDEEFRQLVDFVCNGLLDTRAKPENLRKVDSSKRAQRQNLADLPVGFAEEEDPPQTLNLKVIYAR